MLLITKHSDHSLIHFLPFLAALSLTSEPAAEVRAHNTARHGASAIIFCGAPAIAAALKRACETHSNAQEGTLFELRKENF